MRKSNATSCKEFFLKYGISFASALAIFLVAFFLARLPSTIYASHFRYEDVFGFALGAFMCTGILTAFYRKLLPVYGIFVFLYLLPAYLKLQTNSPVSISELTDTFCFAVLLFLYWLCFGCLTTKSKADLFEKEYELYWELDSLFRFYCHLSLLGIISLAVACLQPVLY